MEREVFRTADVRPKRALHPACWVPLVALALLAGIVSGVVGEDGAGRLLLYGAVERADPGLRIVEAEGGAVRFLGDGTVILEVPRERLRSFSELFPGLSVADTLRPGKRHWVLFLDGSVPVDSLAKYGSLTPLPEPGMLLVAVDESLEERLRGLVFAMVPLPQRVKLNTAVQESGTLTPRRPEAPVSMREALAAGLVPGRLAAAKAVANQVDVDSIAAAIHFVSFDDSSGVLRSRFTFRDDAVWMAHLLREKLRVAMGGVGSDSLHVFTFHYGEDVTVPNVIGLVPGRVPGSGRFLICAHYDATGSRTFYPEEPERRWDYRVDPAPGADDNGSGIASVLECARVLSRLEFDFDLEFALFCAEEQGLFGSAAYAELHEAMGTNIIGTLNFDMHGFRVDPDSTFVRTNVSSEWLSNHISRISDALFDSIGLRVGVTTIDGVIDASDHSSLWINGYDAVHFFEHSRLPALYPHYHTIYDTEDKVNYELAWKVASLGAASLAYFAETEEPWDLEVLSGDIEFRVGSSSFPVSRASSGQLVRIVPSFRNMGAAAETLSIRVSVYDGHPATGGALIGERLFESPVPSGGSPPVEPFGWLLSDADVGKHSVYLTVDAGDSEINTSNNVASRELTVDSDVFDIRYSFVFPNPLRGKERGGSLRFFLTNDAASVEIDIHDVAGRRVGGCKDGECGEFSFGPGEDNEIPLEVLTRGFELASGVYTYRLRVRSSGVERVDVGRFAVVR